ncbi:MAG: amino acid ABC transporter substrate-binding protein [Desulfobacteraceae bacterium]|nr:amino acid ABC transporter substrate-binding protein [Desulfobacteraceae bacterium]
MRSRPKTTWLLVFAFVFAWCFAGLGSVYAQERSEIRVGALVSMTGMNAMTGAEQKWAYEQAVEDINNDGGVYVEEYGKKLPINLIFADDKSQAADAASAMERLIKQQNIDLALSTNITPLNIAAATVCDKYEVFYSITCSWLEPVAAENFEFASDFFTSTRGAAEMPFLIWEEYLPEDKRPSRPALMMEDNRDGQAFGDSFRKLAKEHGYEFVVDDPYTPGSKDFSSHTLKFKSAGVDALLWLGSPTDGIMFMRQMRESNLKIPYIHGWKGFWPSEFINTLGENANYVIHDGFWTERNKQPGAARLGKLYREEHDKDSVSVGLYYANVQVLAEAIEKAGSIDSRKVRDTVFGGEFKGTVKGDIKFNENGICEVPLVALQWWNKERVPVWPTVPGVSKLRLPPKNGGEPRVFE